MADPRFFTKLGPLPLTEVAALSDAAISDSGQADLMIESVGPLGAAPVSALCYAESVKNTRNLEADQLAGRVVIAPEGLVARLKDAGAVVLINGMPKAAFAKASAHLFQPIDWRAGEAIDPSATIGEGAILAPGAVVGPNAVIGAGVYLAPGCAIGAGCVIGARSRIGANAVLTCCEIGEDCNIHAGAVIGEAGFGVAPSLQGAVDVPQFGSVVLGARVTIGANTTIDRAAFGETRIGNDTKIDNLCQIGHNVEIGQSSAIAAFAGISGSVKVGSGVLMGGRVGVPDHVTIGDGVQLAGSANVLSDILEPGVYSGAPAQPIRQHMRELAAIKKLGQRARRSSSED